VYVVEYRAVGRAKRQLRWGTFAPTLVFLSALFLLEVGTDRRTGKTHNAAY